ncbi:unnamed protein product, partial [Mesorhabditis belari]|uniref:Uncharacterized protein n=1 Tax=Mesorhabditis belari TaxID=2138241 RepID=A0AAF3EI96_9BILA
MLSVQSSAFRDDQVIKERFREFIETKLNDCRRIGLDFCTDFSFHFYDGALGKTRVRFVQVSTVTNIFPLIVSSIVEHGIAIQNLEASFRLQRKEMRCSTSCYGKYASNESKSSRKPGNRLGFLYRCLVPLLRRRFGGDAREIRADVDSDECLSADRFIDCRTWDRKSKPRDVFSC